MRKALLVLGLIGASFAGGAVVNGPPLAWARAWLDAEADAEPNDLGAALVGAGLPASVDGAPAAADTGLDPDAPTETFPAVPGGTLAGLRPNGPTAANREPIDPFDPAATAPAAPPPALVAPHTEPEPSSAPSPAPSDPNARPAVLPIEPAPAPTAAPWADAHDSAAPAAAIVPGRPAVTAPPRTAAPNVTRTAAPAASAAPPSEGWPEIQRKMADLGVRRYWFEGTPNGPSRFRCVIPLAGEHAVGQQFEAEADDAIQAARTALKRAALWKATR